MSMRKLGYSTKIAVLILSAVGLTLFAACSDDAEPMESSIDLKPIADPTTDPVLQQGAIYATLDADWNETAQGVKDLIPLAQEEGKVHLTAYGVDHTDALCEAFTTKYGHRV